MWVAIAALSGLVSQCDLPTDPGPQPSTIIETQFEPGMNILGILRGDGTPGSSFIYVERAFVYSELDSLELDESFIPLIDDATVELRLLRDGTLYNFYFEVDSIRGAIYQNPTFSPQPGEAYGITIYHDELPTLTDTTVVPFTPVILSASPPGDNEAVSLVLQSAADIYMYDVYFMTGEDTTRQRIVNPGTGPIELTHQLVGSIDSLTIQLAGYDANLTEYLTATVPIKPQTYNETIRTVTGGYGVLGAVSLTVQTIP